MNLVMKGDEMFQYMETHLPLPRRVEVRRTLLYSFLCSGDRRPHLTCSWLCEPCLSKDLESRTGDPQTGTSGDPDSDAVAAQEFCDTDSPLLEYCSRPLRSEPAGSRSSKEKARQVPAGATEGEKEKVKTVCPIQRLRDAWIPPRYTPNSRNRVSFVNCRVLLCITGDRTGARRETETSKGNEIVP